MKQGPFAKLGADISGMVHVEFIIASLPFLSMVMGLGQIMLLDAAKLAVMHAASAAARAAVVVLDDDPKHYGGEPRNAAPDGSVRHAEIKRAAMGALVAVDAPNRQSSDNDSVLNAISTPSANTSVAELFKPGRWLQSRVRVVFPKSSGGSFGPSDSVTVRVELDYPCTMPVVRRLLCNDGRTHLLTGEATLPNQGAPYEYQNGSAGGGGLGLLSSFGQASGELE